MRLRRIDFLAYGHFTEVGFDLRAEAPDIHFVFGQNEAGKSTALSAIEDLLFGIPSNTRHGFLHDFGSMRLGAVVEGSGNVLELRRRKGTKETLLDKDGLGLPGGEAALGPYLNGAERSFYARMFCLDHERLRRGGREILDAQDDVGQILFSAGAGVAGLREKLRSLHSDADALWGSRRASHRRYFQAEERLKAADAAIRTHSVTAGQWYELKTAYDAAKEAYQSLETEIETKATEARKFGRIRRVCRDVHKHAAASERILELGEVALLPEDAAVRLGSALNEDAHAETRLVALTEQIEALRNELSGLSYDDAILGRSEDIKRLHERRIQVRAEKVDLPKRRAELAAAEADLRRIETELGWRLDDIGEIIARLPARSKLANARALSKRRGALVAAVDNARSASEEAAERVAHASLEIDALGTAADLAGLSATVAAAREAGDLGARLIAAEKEARAAADAALDVSKSMNPVVPEGFDLASILVPAAAVVELHRDRGRDLAQRLRTCRDQIRNTELLLVRHRKEYGRTADDERAVPAEELNRLRERRDDGWAIIRLKYIEGVAVADGEVEAYAEGGLLPDVYATAVEHADKAADQRFERAEATARLAEIARQISEQEEYLDELRGQERGCCADEAAGVDEWLKLWGQFPFVPLSPDEMLDWMASRMQVLLSLEKRSAAEREAGFLRDEESKTKGLLTAELEMLSVDGRPLAARPLRTVLELAADIVRKHEGETATRRKLEETLKSGATDSARKARSLRAAETAFSDWEGEWTSAVTLLGLDPNDAFENVEAQIDAFDEMREIAGRIQDLRHERIEKIERDIAAFEAEVSEVVVSVAAHLTDADRDVAVLELERLLDDATRARELTSAVDVKLIAESEKADECTRARRDAKGVIERLLKEASVSSVDDLRISIARSDELRSLQASQAALRTSLTQDGDGKSVSELNDECIAADLDHIAAREQTVVQELTDLRARLVNLAETRSVARREFEAVGAAAVAAAAAADRQAAICEMKDIAEEYVRIRSAELLLLAAVDRFRRAKQGPLLKRAGELFATLTGGSFKDLQLEYDEHDKAQLAGLRDDGRKVTVSGMSTGSADQLYLALRVAAVEDFMTHSAPLPFIADDLFVNFDDDRAAAGFKVLADLAQKTQVLFFTHHSHLLDLAAAAIGPAISVTSLSAKVARPGARRSVG